jgi:hypothetical protein
MFSGGYTNELIGSEKLIPHQYPSSIKKGSFNILIIDDDVLSLFNLS